MIHIPEDWDKAIAIITNEGGRVIVIGAVDSGKSTFSKLLVDAAARKHEVVLIDADIGQSYLGPPATIEMSVFHSLPDWKNLGSPDSMYFIGDTTPEGHFSLFLSGIKKICMIAEEKRAFLTILDTTGMVSGEGAKMLKRKKMEIFRPDHIVILQRSGESEHLLYPYAYHGEGVNIHRLDVVKVAKTRSKAERRKYRKNRFKIYFEDTEMCILPLNSIEMTKGSTHTPRRLSSSEKDFFSMVIGVPVLYGTKSAMRVNLITAGEVKPDAIGEIRKHYPDREIVITDIRKLEGLLVGLDVNGDNTTALGILSGISTDRDEIQILTPLKDSSKIQTIRLGNLKVKTSGEEERFQW